MQVKNQAKAALPVKSDMSPNIDLGPNLDYHLELNLSCR